MARKNCSRHSSMSPLSKAREGSVLDIGLRLFQSLVDGLPVVETSGKVYDFGADEDIRRLIGFLSWMPSSEVQTAECHVCLVHRQIHHLWSQWLLRLKVSPLTLVDSDGPSQPDGILGEAAQDFFFYFFCLFVVAITDMFAMIPVLRHILFHHRWWRRSFLLPHQFRQSHRWYRLPTWRSKSFW